MIYIQLFLSFLQIGLFSVGGGYAAIPLVQSLIVERQGLSLIHISVEKSRYCVICTRTVNRHRWMRRES